MNPANPLTEAPYPAIQHICEAVGAYSEAFEACCYNEEDVLALLLSGKMNTRAEKMLDLDLAGINFRSQMGRFFREDGLYEEQLRHYVKQASDCWPVDYMPMNVPAYIPIQQAADRFLVKHKLRSLLQA